MPDSVAPAIETAIRGALHAIGCCRHDAEDIAHNVALRLMTTTFDAGHLGNPTGWAVTVATRMYLDQLRRLPHRDLLSADLLPDQPSAVDVDRVVQHRLDLTAVGAAIARLSEADRQMMLRAAADNPPPLNGCDRVRLHRIRKWVKTVAGLAGAAVLLATLGQSSGFPSDRHRAQLHVARHDTAPHSVRRSA